MPNRARFSPRLLTTLALVFATASAAAQQPAAPVEAAARQLIEAQTQGLPGEVSIELSPLDANNQLPPCAELSAFLPASSRAWGAFSVGVRCASPAAWTVYLQARVKVSADYIVSARPLRANQIIGPADLATRRGDLAALGDDVLTDASQAVGQHARYALAQGRPLQTHILRVPAAVQRGNSVTIVGRGAGFQISNTGRAMNSAAPGETVRVRLPNNQVITGTAQTNGTVEMAY
jgi:flagella basal body P-ring formation protein FlgA